MALLDINWNPTKKELRVFALLLVVFATIVAAMLYLRYELLIPAVAVIVTGFVVAGVGVLIPKYLRFVYATWMVAAFPIGWTVSHTVVALVYYLLFTPIGLMMRLLGRDPLHRDFDPTTNSYWKPRNNQDGVDRYFRQF